MGIIVIDQNYFRKPALVQLLKADSGAVVAIPDVALVEMCKSSHWESTLRGSLLPLSPYVERCVCLTNVGEPLSYEANNHKAFDGSLINEEFSAVLRSLIKKLDSGDGPEIAMFREKVPSIIREIKPEDLNHKANKRSLSGTVDVLLDSFRKDLTKALRNGSISRELEIQLITQNMPALMTSYMDHVSFSYEERESYIERRPFTYRFLALRLWLSIHWLKKGGLQTLPEWKVTNHIMDNEYALMASYFDDFLSDDTLANEAYVNLCEIISK